ncbi:MAG: EVE domain-containing protein [Bacteroidales bacterium]|nr:EVE domain-containing protein [Bacteroidales bacterium]
MKQYWLIKTEPSTYGWDDLVKKGSGMWDGVRNYQARNNLRQMKQGDLALFYHSGKNPGITGLTEITREAYPDPTAVEGEWSAVDLKPVRPLKRFIPLEEIKQKRELKNMVLVKNTRLSVQPVTAGEYDFLLKMELTT